MQKSEHVPTENCRKRCAAIAIVDAPYGGFAGINDFRRQGFCAIVPLSDFTARPSGSVKR
jgi:hypothetical protein